MQHKDSLFFLPEHQVGNDVKARLTGEVRGQILAAVQGHGAVPGVQVHGCVILKPQMSKKILQQDIWEVNMKLLLLHLCGN